MNAALLLIALSIAPLPITGDIAPSERCSRTPVNACPVGAEGMADCQRTPGVEGLEGSESPKDSFYGGLQFADGDDGAGDSEEEQSDEPVSVSGGFV
jgi:hypothetical protein